ncbi:MazG-like family protein [uncultured Roseobacter sp.]|uniref:MazG-like family protein n=1 Tax=uncultured Roseobacter sp. TaxID=114847 RepID=UPI002625F4A3|nr:MazG-like family protein [uncultured Roseobacter sp.]
MLNELRKSNQARQDAWPGGEEIDLAFRGLELGGEAGELLNKLKKLTRLDRGIQGQKAEEIAGQRGHLLRDIAEELADVVICADLIAMHLGIDLAPEIPAKFDKTSRKNGIPVYFGERSTLHNLAAEAMPDDEKRGLYSKFKVERTDGRSAPGEKHHDCEYFVLDMDHDEHARAAIEAYVKSLEDAEQYPGLAADLRYRYL